MPVLVYIFLIRQIMYSAFVEICFRMHKTKITMDRRLHWICSRKTKIIKRKWFYTFMFVFFEMKYTFVKLFHDLRMYWKAITINTRSQWTVFDYCDKNAYFTPFFFSLCVINFAGRQWKHFAYIVEKNVNKR